MTSRIAFGFSLSSWKVVTLSTSSYKEEVTSLKTFASSVFTKLHLVYNLCIHAIFCIVISNLTTFCAAPMAISRLLIWDSAFSWLNNSNIDKRKKVHQAGSHLRSLKEEPIRLRWTSGHTDALRLSWPRAIHLSTIEWRTWKICSTQWFTSLLRESLRDGDQNLHCGHRVLWIYITSTPEYSHGLG